ncbi:MAG: glycosyltransferase family 4 protein [Planctomycetota bacterium]|jgi:glycosyltransferase involved in cell wall biosynthesis
MTTTRRLTLVIHSLRGGGAERVAAMLVSHWAERGDRVTLITLEPRQPDAYPVSDKVRWVALDLMRRSPTPFHAVWNNWRRVRGLRRAIRQSAPQIVVSHCDKTNVLVLLACKTLETPVVVVEHSNLRHHDVGRAWSWLRKRTYPRAAALVVLSEPSREPGKSLAAARPVFVIPNAVPPVSPATIRAARADLPADRRRTVVAMGRLSYEKGFDLLIRAFGSIAGEHPAWDLKILGEGDRRAELEGLVDELGLDRRVQLAGWIADPTADLCRADLYVMSSRYEASPLALQEAMACGLPAISFDCPTGPRDVVRHEVDGLLVPPGDVGQLAGAMGRLMAHSHQRARFASRAGEISGRFSPEEFFARWDAVLRLDVPG